MKVTERIGAILAVASKPRVLSSLRSGLTPRFGRVLTAETVQEARRAMEREKIALILLFTPLKDDEEIPRLLDMAERRLVAVACVVRKEIYGEFCYRTEDRNVFVASYPLQMDQVLQITSFLYRSQERLQVILTEQERLLQQLQDVQIISRVKCLLIERLKMTEEEAHHYIERTAMNGGISKREAANRILKEL